MAQISVFIDSMKVNVKDEVIDYAVDLYGSRCKVWAGFGLSSFEGPIVDLEKLYPELLSAMKTKGYIKEMK